MNILRISVRDLNSECESHEGTTTPNTDIILSQKG